MAAEIIAATKIMGIQTDNINVIIFVQSGLVMNSCLTLLYCKIKKKYVAIIGRAIPILVSSTDDLLN